MKALLVLIVLVNSVLSKILNERLLNSTRTTTSILQEIASKIINQKNIEKKANSILNKKAEIINSFLDKKQTSNSNMVKSTVPDIYSSKIKNILEKSANIFMNITSNVQSSKKTTDSSNFINSFGNRVLIDTFIKQGRENNDQTMLSLQSDILKLSKSRIKREDIINYIKQKQPTFSISDANNLLVNVHIDSKMSLPGTRETVYSRAVMAQKNSNAVKNFIKSSLAMEANNIKNNISIT
jgi:hypothetical protein